jgi:hypothetical protein
MILAAASYTAAIRRERTVLSLRSGGRLVHRVAVLLSHSFNRADGRAGQGASASGDSDLECVDFRNIARKARAMFVLDTARVPPLQEPVVQRVPLHLAAIGFFHKGEDKANLARFLGVTRPRMEGSRAEAVSLRQPALPREL